MEKELEKELEELVREALKPENRTKLLLAVLIAKGMSPTIPANQRDTLDAIHGRLVSYGDPLFNDYVKEMIESNEVKLKNHDNIVKVNYSLVSEKSPDEGAAISLGISSSSQWRTDR